MKPMLRKFTTSIVAATAIAGFVSLPASSKAAPGAAATQGWMQSSTVNVYAYGVMSFVNGKYSGQVYLSGYVNGQYFTINTMIGNPVFNTQKDATGKVVSNTCTASVNIIYNRVPANLSFQWTDYADGLSSGNVSWTIRNLSSGALMNASPAVAPKVPYVIVKLPV
jgi:hypothetical protein